MGTIGQKFAGLALEDKAILVSGVGLVIDSFLPWYQAGGVSFNAWEDPGSVYSVLAIVIGVVMAGLVSATRLAGLRLPPLPGGTTWAMVHLGLALFAGVLILMKIFEESNFMSYGFFLGIILVGGLIAGSILMVQDQQIGGPTPPESSARR